MSEEDTSKIIHAQTVLFESDVAALKVKIGERSIKDAIAKAVEHYLDVSFASLKAFGLNFLKFFIFCHIEDLH